MAEAQFRYGIFLPLALIIVLVAIESSLWWLFLLIAPFLLFGRGMQHSFRAGLILVQAIVLRMVEPPVFERLREVLAKKQQQGEKKLELTNGEKEASAASLTT
jgi:hypothetical protein